MVDHCSQVWFCLLFVFLIFTLLTDSDQSDDLIMTIVRTKGWNGDLLMVCMLMMISCTLSMGSETCPRPRPRPQRFVLGLGLGLENLSSFNITGFIQ